MCVFSLPAPATAGGYAAVGLPAATLTDAAVATAAPPVFAASGAADDPAWPAYSAFAAPCTRLVRGLGVAGCLAER